jgi:hypothetical protein
VSVSHVASNRPTSVVLKILCMYILDFACQVLLFFKLTLVCFVFSDRSPANCKKQAQGNRKGKVPDGDESAEDAFARLYQDSMRRRKELEELRARAEAAKRRQEETLFKTHASPMSEQLLRDKGCRAPARQIFEELYSQAQKRQQSLDARIQEAQMRAHRDAMAERPSAIQPGSKVSVGFGTELSALGL